MSSLTIASARSEIWLDVPFVRQVEHGCGAACISMVMQYWSKNPEASPTNAANASTIMEELYFKRAGGILATDMERYFKDHAFRTFVFAGEWTDLNHHLSQGRPLIVCLEDGKREVSRHYVVVTGLDPAQGIVLLNDPARRKLLKLEREVFERSWNTAKNWTLLALPQHAR